MISLKIPKEIEAMKEGGAKLRRVLNKVLRKIRPGVTKAYLDRVAEKEIRREQGFPSFKMVPGYKWATCITVNEEVVHGIPGEREIKKGDIVSVDVGIFYKGFHTDLSETVLINGGEDRDKEKFLSVGRLALEKAIRQVRVGKYVGDISRALQETIEAAGYSPVQVLTGHGIGKKLHEDPGIPCFLAGEVSQTAKIRVGMVLAIEVIYNLGKEEVVLKEDGWTISTRDGKISGLFEETVAVTEDGPLVLTR